MNDAHLHIDDALAYLARHPAEKCGLSPATGGPVLAPIQCAAQYDVEIKFIAAAFWASKGISILNQTMSEGEQYFRPFFDAAWYLCRVGVLRPGEIAPSVGMRGPGWNGDGFSVTSVGRTWLAITERPPSDVSRLVQIMQPFAARFGPGFVQRAVEASECYQRGNYLACCAMAGAAAESILLAIAIAKVGDEAKVLAEYRSATGRTKVTNRILSGANRSLSEQFSTINSVLRYWRDDTAHGIYTTVGEAQANVSLTQLIRFAHLANDHWDSLTVH